jgi:hypothetical protein
MMVDNDSLHDIDKVKWRFFLNVGEEYVEVNGLFMKDPSSVIYCQMWVMVGMLIANIRWSGLVLLSPLSLSLFFFAFFCVFLDKKNRVYLD